MLEAVAIIFAIAPPGIRDFQSAGGKQRVKDRRYASWIAWRKDALMEYKKALKSNPKVSKANMRKHIRIELNPDCTDNTIDVWLTKWNARFQKVLSKLNSPV